MTVVLLGPGRVNQHMASSLLAARVCPAMSRDETPGSRPSPRSPLPPQLGLPPGPCDYSREPLESVAACQRRQDDLISLFFLFFSFFFFCLLRPSLLLFPALPN